MGMMRVGRILRMLRWREGIDLAAVAVQISFYTLPATGVQSSIYQQLVKDLATQSPTPTQQHICCTSYVPLHP